MQHKNRDKVTRRMRLAMRLGVVLLLSPAGRSVARDGLYVQVSDVIARQQQGAAYALVDVRGKPAFMRQHVPGSVQMSLLQFKARAVYKGRPVVLIDEGWGDAILEEEGTRLRSAGYEQLFILAGGMNAWTAAGQPTMGRAPCTSATQNLSARDFLSARSSGHWMVIDGGPEGDPALPGYGAMALDLAGDAAASAERIRSLAAARDGFTRVLVADADGSGYDGIRRALGTLPQAAVFYLEGGWAALRRAEGRVAALQSRSRRVVRSSSSVGAPSGLQVKPCGGCP